MLEALGEWMGYAAYYTSYGGSPPPRTGAKHAAIAPYGPFVAGDGEVVYLAIQNEREWSRFCATVLERAELAVDPRFQNSSRRVQNRVALEQIINEIFQRLTRVDVIARLESAQTAYARLNSVQEFVEHPQLAARQRWREIESPAGPLRALIPPATIEGVESRMGAVPALGQHTQAILEELGFDAATVAAWKSAGVI